MGGRALFTHITNDQFLQGWKQQTGLVGRQWVHFLQDNISQIIQTKKTETCLDKDTDIVMSAASNLAVAEFWRCFVSQKLYTNIIHSTGGGRCFKPLSNTIDNENLVYYTVHKHHKQILWLEILKCFIL